MPDKKEIEGLEELLKQLKKFGKVVHLNVNEAKKTKTVQEIDREKLEKKFSKSNEKKKLN